MWDKVCNFFIEENIVYIIITKNLSKGADIDLTRSSKIMYLWMAWQAYN